MVGATLDEELASRLTVRERLKEAKKLNEILQILVAVLLERSGGFVRIPVEEVEFDSVDGYEFYVNMNADNTAFLVSFDERDVDPQVELDYDQEDPD